MFEKRKQTGSTQQSSITLAMERTGVQRREGSRWEQAQESCHGNTGAELECKTQAGQGKGQLRGKKVLEK